MQRSRIFGNLISRILPNWRPDHRDRWVDQSLQSLGEDTQRFWVLAFLLRRLDFHVPVARSFGCGLIRTSISWFRDPMEIFVMPRLSDWFVHHDRAIRLLMKPTVSLSNLSWGRSQAFSPTFLKNSIGKEPADESCACYRPLASPFHQRNRFPQSKDIDSTR